MLFSTYYFLIQNLLLHIKSYFNTFCYLFNLIDLLHYNMKYIYIYFQVHNVLYWSPLYGNNFASLNKFFIDINILKYLKILKISW